MANLPTQPLQRTSKPWCYYLTTSDLFNRPDSPSRLKPGPDNEQVKTLPILQTSLGHSTSHPAHVKLMSRQVLIDASSPDTEEFIPRCTRALDHLKTF